MENDEEVCPICYEDLDSEDNNHTLECNHKYHTKCIIKWFRNSHSNCPLCNDNTIDTSNMPWGVKLQTIAEIKKLGRRKGCPANIKKQLNNIKKISEDEKKWKKEFIDFKKENKDLIKKHQNLRYKRYTFARKKRQAEYKLLAIAEINPIYIK